MQTEREGLRGFLQQQQREPESHEKHECYTMGLQPISNFLPIVADVPSHLPSDAQISQWSTLHQSREAILEVLFLSLPCILYH